MGKSCYDLASIASTLFQPADSPLLMNGSVRIQLSASFSLSSLRAGNNNYIQRTLYSLFNPSNQSFPTGSWVHLQVIGDTDTLSPWGKPVPPS